MKLRRRTTIILIIVPAVLLALYAYVQVAGKMETERISAVLPHAAAAPVAAVDGAQLMQDVTTLASPEYQGRGTGTEGARKAQAYLQRRFEELGLAPLGAGYAHAFSFTDTSIKGLVMPGRPYKTEYKGAVNMLATIKGTAHPERYIVISAHYDHLGVREGVVYPGADDNASGVAALLATAAWFKQHPPAHSIVFAAFDAEELGLRGAQAFLAGTQVPPAQIVANLNLDMLSRSDDKSVFVAGTSYTPAFKPLVEQVARRSMVKVRLGHDRPMWRAGTVEDWTGSSDHGPFHDAGVPFLYFGVADHEDYHGPGDIAAKIDPGFFTNVASLVVDMAVALDRQPIAPKKS